MTVTGSLAVAPPGGSLPVATSLMRGAVPAAGALPGRGHVLGSAAAASRIDGKLPVPWRACVQAVTGVSMFVLAHDDVVSALRLGGAPPEERAALADSLRAADALSRLFGV